MKHCVACARDFEAEEWRCPACGFQPRAAAGFPSFLAGPEPARPAEFDEGVYQRMMECERRSFYFRARRRLILWALGRHFPDARRFYDLGTGTGFVLAAIREARPDLELWGSDLSPDSLALTARRLDGRAILFHTDAARLPFTEHFDAIGAFDVLEHVADDAAALRHMARALRPGGGLLLTAPQHMALWSRLDEETGHKRRYVGRELAAKAERAGLAVLLDTGFMASLFPLQYVSRRFLAPDPRRSFEAEHLLPAPLNRSLEAVLAAELALIRAGVRFPFGGLRLVVARKR
jgi:SAM-dependent methyltransferase